MLKDDKSCQVLPFPYRNARLRKTSRSEKKILCIIHNVYFFANL